MEDEAVKAEIAKLQLPEGTVVMADPWIYGMMVSMALHISGTNTNHRVGRRGRRRTHVSGLPLHA
jgi:hypothetical protein